MSKADERMQRAHLRGHPAEANFGVVLRTEHVTIREVIAAGRLLSPDETVITKLMASIPRVGLLHPIVVQEHSTPSINSRVGRLGFGDPAFKQRPWGQARVRRRFVSRELFRPLVRSMVATARRASSVTAAKKSYPESAAWPRGTAGTWKTPMLSAAY